MCIRDRENIHEQSAEKSIDVVEIETSAPKQEESFNLTRDLKDSKEAEDIKEESIEESQDVQEEGGRTEGDPIPESTARPGV